MSVSINQNPNNQYSTFKGKSKTDNGNDYYKSNVGKTIGSIIGLSSAIKYFQKEDINKVKKALEDKNLPPEVKEALLKSLGFKNEQECLTKLKKTIDRNKKYAIPFALTTVATSLGAGAYVDYMRNKKAKEAADIIASNNNKLILSNKDIDITDNNKPYYRTRTGSKNGALLGSLCGLTSLLMNSSLKKSPLITTISIATCGLGGLIVGLISDSITNHNAKKHA